jgi:2-methylcitrate dehydratase PrpD
VIREPKDLTSAQFSAVFSVALFLVKGGAGFREYTEENLLDPVVRELSSRVHLEVDDAIQQAFDATNPRNASATVRLKSGEILHERVDSLHLMTPDEVDDKFRSLASVVMDRPQYDEIVSRVRNLEDVPDVTRLAAMLVARPYST